MRNRIVGIKYTPPEEGEAKGRTFAIYEHARGLGRFLPGNYTVREHEHTEHGSRTSRTLGAIKETMVSGQFGSRKAAWRATEQELATRSRRRVEI